MIFHQFVTKSVMVPTYNSNMINAFIGVILYKQMGHHFSYLIWVTRWHMNPFFTYVICDNLLTKHLTHMVYISRPLVRKFCIL